MITIGMPSYNNAEQVWFTIQSLRMYQNIEGCEILVLDNQGNENTEKAARDCKVRYELINEVNGTGPARNAIFEKANYPFVLVIDSHVLLWPDSIQRLKWWLMNNWDEAKNLLHGPLVMSNLENTFTHYEPKWRKQMWGIWPPAQNVTNVEGEAFEIGMMGCGVFGCRKDSWLGFHKDCKGFDGVEGVIHEKYRKSGKKVLCLPFLKWVHKFNEKGRGAGYPLLVEDKIRNFLLGFNEIELDPKPIYDHFGQDKVVEIAKTIERKAV